MLCCQQPERIDYNKAKKNTNTENKHKRTYFKKEGSIAAHHFVKIIFHVSDLLHYKRQSSVHTNGITDNIMNITDGTPFFFGYY